MITRDQAIIIFSALTLLPYARLVYSEDSQNRKYWVIEYGEKDNRHSTFVGYTLSDLALTLSGQEWGGWAK